MKSFREFITESSTIIIEIASDSIHTGIEYKLVKLMKGSMKLEKISGPDRHYIHGHLDLDPELWTTTDFQTLPDKLDLKYKADWKSYIRASDIIQGVNIDRKNNNIFDVNVNGKDYKLSIDVKFESKEAFEELIKSKR